MRFKYERRDGDTGMFREITRKMAESRIGKREVQEAGAGLRLGHKIFYAYQNVRIKRIK